MKTTFLRCTVFPTLFLPSHQSTFLVSVSVHSLHTPSALSSHPSCPLFTPLPLSPHTPPHLVLTSSHPLRLNLLACRILNVHSCEQEGFQLLTAMLKVLVLLQRHTAVSHPTCSPCVHTYCPETSPLTAVNSLQWCHQGIVDTSPSPSQIHSVGFYKAFDLCLNYLPSPV